MVADNIFADKYKMSFHGMLTKRMPANDKIMGIVPKPFFLHVSIFIRFVKSCQLPLI